MTVEKGADVLAESLPFLRDLPLSVSFLGEGRQREALQARVRELGLEPRVSWHGPVADAERVLAAFDVLVISSRTEGTPILLFEAMAAGVPIVTTAVGGIPDVVSAREALLVPAERPDALATAIRNVFTDHEGAEARVRAASTVLNARFGTGPWLDAYVGLYETVGRNVRPLENA
jgi:glycosyltransferase involved in cell wall biosynthesis